MFGQIPYSKEQKRTLEEKGAAFGEARERYNRKLWDLTEVLSGYGRRKREVCELLMGLPMGCKSQRCQQILERSLFALQSGRGDERSGATGAALREWGRRDLSFPDIEGKKPQEAFAQYEAVCAALNRDADKFSSMVEPITRWVSCAGALMNEVRLRQENPTRAKRVADLLALFLDAELFRKEGAEILLRREELKLACDAIEAAVAAVVVQRKKTTQE